MGKLYVVGFGPGGYEHMTEKAIEVIKNADVVTGIFRGRFFDAFVYCST